MTQVFACGAELEALRKAISASKNAETKRLENAIVKRLYTARKGAEFKNIIPFLPTLRHYAENLNLFLKSIGTFATPSDILTHVIKGLTSVKNLALSSAQSDYNYTRFLEKLQRFFRQGSEKLAPWDAFLRLFEESRGRCTPVEFPEYPFEPEEIPVPPPIEAFPFRSISAPPSIKSEASRSISPRFRRPTEKKNYSAERRLSEPSIKIEGINPFRRSSLPEHIGLPQQIEEKTSQTSHPEMKARSISPCPSLDSKTLDRISPILSRLPWNSEQFLAIARILRYLKDENGQPYLSPRFTPSQSRFAQKTIVPETRGHYGVRGKLILPSHLYEMLRGACGNVDSFVRALEEIRDRRFRTQHLDDKWTRPQHNEEWKTQQELLNKNFKSSSETSCLQTEQGDIQDLIHLIRFGNLNGTDLHSAVQLLSLETKMRSLPRNIFRVGLLSGDIRPQVDKYRGANNMNPRERKPSLLAELLEQNCTNIPLLNHFIYTNLLTPVQQNQFQTLRGNLK